MTRLDWAEYGWKWFLRLGGAAAAAVEIAGAGRASVLILAAGAMGLPTIMGLGKR